jgi:branched-chain amino acid transport system permease protein
MQCPSAIRAHRQGAKRWSAWRVYTLPRSAGSPFKLGDTDSMDFSIASILALDGATNGAVYALLALATVLVFVVTRVIFIPQGEFVAFGALTLAMLQMGRLPGTVLLLAGLAIGAAAIDAAQALRRGMPAARIAADALRTLAVPLVISLIAWWAAPRQWPLLPQALLSLAIVTPLGPLIYRLAYQSLADASVLVLLIVSVGVHFALTGLGLVFFGAEGFRNPSFWDERFTLGPLLLSGQTVIVIAASAMLIVALWLFFERSLQGKALRATAVNRLGARLMGISSESAGRLSFTMAAFIGALSGLLIGPTTTVFYDSGFLIGLKGFVAAVFGGLASYPLALVGALGVGLIESFGSFWASAFKEVIVFGSILPVLLWRSLRDPHGEEH